MFFAVLRTEGFGVFLYLYRALMVSNRGGLGILKEGSIREISQFVSEKYPVAQNQQKPNFRENLTLGW